MRSKFEVHTRLAEPSQLPTGRYRVLRSDRCIGCGECIRRCIYGVHLRREDDPRLLAEPVSGLCRACLVCPQTCPRDALDVVPEPDLAHIGCPPYDADAVLTIWAEARDGKIPVRGCGYAGPFRGEGFDGIWTDMSEIVRPTRDGIHGREYISTAFDLGRKLSDLTGLRFDDGHLLDRIPLTREIPVPFLFRCPHRAPDGLHVLSAMVRAAMELETFVLVDLERVRGLHRPASVEPRDARAVRYLRENRNHVVLRLDDEAFAADGRPRQAEVPSDAVLPVRDPTGWSSVVQVVDGPEVLERILRLRADHPDLIVMVEVPAAPGSPARLVELAQGGVDAVHLAAGWRGTWADGTGDPTVVVGAIRDAHLALVRAGLRDQVSLLVSGGIARAEHVPKAILLGADAVVLDVPLLAGMGCRVTPGCAEASCAELADLDPKWGVSRLVNLMAAWRNQLLEVLGAMGLREVRRLRGEVGRGLFADDLEAEFVSELRPLEPGESALQAPWERSGADGQDGAGSRMHASYGPWRVVRDPGCEACGACTEACSRGVLTWPGGLQQPPPPRHDRCLGPDCPDGCVAACPNGLIHIEPDHRLDVVDHHRWPHRLMVETWNRARGLPAAALGTATATGRSDGGFDLLRVVAAGSSVSRGEVDLSLDLNRRSHGPRVRIPLPIYGGGMSYGSVSQHVMVGRAHAAQEVGTFTCTGEGGFPEELVPYAEHIITQIATGYFGVREQTIQRARLVEFKYAQGAKPGLGGHLLGDKNTETVARLREAVPGTALFSPFPFHSVYSIEDHRKHVDWVRQINPDVLVSVKVSTPGDVDMVAVGSYHAGANIVHLDGAYGGTGAAPEVAKKNIAMPIELALSRTHRFLVSEGIRDEIVLMASGGIRTPMDVVKAIALGADGVVVGTAELIAIECVLCRNCEKDRGCPRGIATTDPVLEAHLDADWVAVRIVNLYRAWERELRWILSRLGLDSVGALRGRSDLLRHLPREGER